MQSAIGLAWPLGPLTSREMEGHMLENFIGEVQQAWPCSGGAKMID